MPDHELGVFILTSATEDVRNVLRKMMIGHRHYERIQSAPAGMGDSRWLPWGRAEDCSIDGCGVAITGITSIVAARLMKVAIMVLLTYGNEQCFRKRVMADILFVTRIAKLRPPVRTSDRLLTRPKQE